MIKNNAVKYVTEIVRFKDQQNVGNGHTIYKPLSRKLMHVLLKHYTVKSNIGI